MFLLKISFISNGVSDTVPLGEHLGANETPETNNIPGFVSVFIFCIPKGLTLLKASPY